MNTQTPFFENNLNGEDVKNYFNTLPKNIQETIIQSHGKPQTLDELKNLAEGLMNKN